MTESARFRIRSYKIAKDLEKFNIIPNKTKTYDVPRSVIDNYNFKHYLRGYFDGDGWYSQYFSKRSNKTKIAWGICGNYEVILKFKQKIENDLEITGSFYKEKNIWKFIVNNQHSIKILSDFLYGNSLIYLDRKYEISKKTKEYDDNNIILNFDKNKLQEAYDRLGTYKKVAKEFGCCVSSISNYCKKYNIRKKCLNIL